jgi:hypothetical protein
MQPVKVRLRMSNGDVFTDPLVRNSEVGNDGRRYRTVILARAIKNSVESHTSAEAILDIGIGSLKNRIFPA